ncbi:MAG: ABC transporter permease, partial [Spirochaetia bacterium]|nr:ABC transporter permease [Spirochaetia bacterium]
CAACTTATAPARKSWWNTALGCLPPWITARSSSPSLSRLWGQPCIPALRQDPTNWQKPTKWWSKSFLLFFVLVLAIPNFWLGMLMMQLFSVRLGWLPSIGYGSTLSIIMPSLAVSARLIALIARLTRSTIIDVLHQDYIRTAESKGIPTWKIILKHGIRPALPPILTLIGLQAGYLLGGSIVIENLFSYQGMGQLLLAAQSLRDYNLMQGIIIFFVAGFLMINLFVDILYTVIDPRVSLQ